MPDDEPILAACHVAKQVNSPDGILTIVDDGDCVVAPGESMAIMGPSGAGKSTLLAMLAGLETPSSGQVMMFGENLAALDEDGRAAVRSQRVGFVFQSFHLIPSLTALENVMLPLELAGVQGAHARAQEALGHNSKAVHRAYARKASVLLPSFEEFEARVTPIIAFPGDAPGTVGPGGGLNAGSARGG